MVIFGGGGSYITRIKRRETFNDVYFYDTHEREWLDLNEMQSLKALKSSNVKSKDNKLVEAPNKRLGHSSAIIGNTMIIMGGIYGEDNKVLDDTVALDLTMMNWIKIKKLKSC